MVSVTISVPDSVYALLARRAEDANRSVQSFIEDQVVRLTQDDPEDPAFVAAMRHTIERNRGLLDRLAQ